MDFTKIECISESCKDKHINMRGAGGSFGGRISIAKVKCPECGLTLMVVPMEDAYRYQVSAMTEKEQDEVANKKRRFREIEQEADDLRRQINSM